MSDYYARVGAYFDAEADAFDERYWANPILQRMRQSFREEVKRLPFRTALEIGCGTGLDVRHFATIYPERRVVGIDVSTAMLACAERRMEAAGLRNARTLVASADDAPDIEGPEAFDMVYVFFGALNTVEDLDRAADRLYDATAPGGHLVLTFVNRWHLATIAVGLLRGRGREAFRRLRSEWGGYNPERPLSSQCRSPGEVTAAFGPRGALVKRRGFSIAYPAWFWARWLPKLGRAERWLSALDALLNRTPAWSWGEYTLFVFRKHR